MGLWARGKGMDGRWRPPEYVPELDLPLLLRLRDAFRAKLEAHIAAVAARREVLPWWLGYAPNSTAWECLADAGVKYQGGTPALHCYVFQRIQVAEGTWEAGPGRWRTLPAVLTRPGGGG